MTISYEWRGQFTSAEANGLHAECFEHRVLSDGQWDWRGQVERHSLGWVCARDGAELVGLDTMAAAGARRHGVGTRLVEVAVERSRAAGCTSTSRTTCAASTSTPAGSPRPTPG
jgi:GNAT superfamily N-acetyltransferase